MSLENDASGVGEVSVAFDNEKSSLETAHGLKRSAADEKDEFDSPQQPAPKRLKSSSNLLWDSTKNVMSLLNELRPTTVYKVLSSSGPSHAPVFTISVTVDGQVKQFLYTKTCQNL